MCLDRPFDIQPPWAEFRRPKLFCNASQIFPKEQVMNNVKTIGLCAEDFPRFGHQIPKPNERKKTYETTMNTIYTTLALVKIDSWRLVLLLATAVSLIGYPKPARAATFNVTVGAFNPHTWSDNWFVPLSVTIHPGDQVIWVWASSGHSTTSGSPGM